MIILGPVCALAALWLLGALALTLVDARRHAGIDQLVADFAAGVVILAAFGMTTLSLGGRISILPVYALLALLAAAAGWRRRSIRIRLRPPRSLRAQALLMLAGITLIALGISASQDRLVWDGWAFWTLKARILFLEGTLPAAALDPAGPYPYAHPEYPLAVPLVDWWLYRHAGTASPALASLAGVVWFAALPAYLWAALRPHLDEASAALATLGIAAFWPLAFYASGGYADVVIALAILGAAIELERARVGNGRDTIYRLATFLTLAALTKNEGLALAAIALPISAILAARSWRLNGERRAGSLIALAVPFLASAPWFIFTRRLGLVPQHLADAAPSLTDALTRVPTILSALGGLVFTRSWVPLPFLVAAGLIAAARRRRLAAPAGWALAAGYGATIFGVYLTTALELEWLLSTTIDRMAGDLVPAIVALALIEIWAERKGGDSATPTASS